MSKIKELEEAIGKLTAAEFAELRDWLLERDADMWDAQIERDAESGKLDALFTSRIGSPEGRAIEATIGGDHLTSPAKAVFRVLRQQAGVKTPIDEMRGAFSSPEDSAIVDEAMKHVRELRKTDARPA